jgi:predicted MFS family arabinose efflux permease
VSVLSRRLLVDRDQRKALIISGFLLLPVCFSLSLPMPVYLFIALMCLYQLLNGACAVYQNHLKLEFASAEKTSIDLAAFKTLSNAAKPIAVLAAGFLAETMGFSWVFYFSAFLVLCSALIPLALPKAPWQPGTVIVNSYGAEVAAIEK